MVARYTAIEEDFNLPCQDQPASKDVKNARHLSSTWHSNQALFVKNPAIDVAFPGDQFLRCEPQRNFLLTIFNAV